MIPKQIFEQASPHTWLPKPPTASLTSISLRAAKTSLLMLYRSRRRSYNAWRLILKPLFHPKASAAIATLRGTLVHLWRSLTNSNTILRRKADLKIRDAEWVDRKASQPNLQRERPKNQLKTTSTDSQPSQVFQILSAPQLRLVRLVHPTTIDSEGDGKFSKW